jgi:hypothetical protein
MYVLAYLLTLSPYVFVIPLISSLSLLRDLPENSIGLVPVDGEANKIVDNVSLISPSIYFSLPSDSNLRLVLLLILYLSASPIYHPERKLTATHRSSAGTLLLRSLSARPSSPFLTHVIAQVCWVGFSLCFVDLGLERLCLRARVSEAQGALAVSVGPAVPAL